MFGGGRYHFSAHDICQGEVDINVSPKVCDLACDEGLRLERLAHLADFFSVIRVGRLQV